MHNQVPQIEAKANNIFIALGFDLIMINNTCTYKNNGGYHKLTYVDGLAGFVIEWAPSLDDAMMGKYEDGDLLPISLGTDELLCRLGYILKKQYS